MRRLVLVAALVGTAVASTSARAHNRSASYSTWAIRGTDARVTVSLSSLEATRLPWMADAGADARLGKYLVERLQLTAAGRPCPPTGDARRLESSPARVVYEWDVECAGSVDRRIESRLFLDVAPSHLHFARIRLDDGPPVERVLSNEQRVWPLDPTGGGNEIGGSSLVSYLHLGVLHILTGYDHLAFLLALLLVGGSLLDVARIVTGFTVAHSVTLALTVLGVLHPERAPIEALIGLSIALVAAENLWLVGGMSRTVAVAIPLALALLAGASLNGWGNVPAPSLGGLALFVACYFALIRRLSRPAWLRAAIAFLFGLVHGFGFASVLLEVKLPADRLVPALLGFNLGVEMGQLVVVAAAWPLLVLVLRSERPAIRSGAVELGSTAVLVLGVFWFVSRAFG